MKGRELLGLCLLSFLGCVAGGCSRQSFDLCTTPARYANEKALRACLGVPSEAEKVMIFGQSSHLDFGWVKTTEEYFAEDVVPILSQSLDALDGDPGFSAFFAEVLHLRRFMEERPRDLSRFLHHIKRRRLHIVGGAHGTPDNLLPDGEAIVRDYLLGNNWLTQTLETETMSAWLPDSFGHSPSLPDILEAMGFVYVGLGRLDGILKPMDLITGGRIVPLPDSSAETLLSLGSSAFMWVGSGGGEVLAYWMPYMYSMGDDIDCSSPWINIGGACVGANKKDPSLTNSKISGYIERLTPFWRTPYIFVPVGVDFARPIKDYPLYLRWWNETEYPSTGVWAAMAGFEDFMRLVEYHKAGLPRLSMDMSSLWTGFFGSRPHLKLLIKRLTSNLLSAEVLGMILTKAGFPFPQKRINTLWETVGFSNDHGVITGTGYDRAAQTDHLPRIEASLKESEGLKEELLAALSNGITVPVFKDIPVLVFNPSGVERDDVVEGMVDIPSPGTTALRLYDSGAEEIPLQFTPASAFTDGTLETASVSFVARDVPAMGYRVYFLERSTGSPGSSITAVTDAGGITVDSPWLRAYLSKSAGYSFTSLYHKGLGMEFLNGTGNDLVVYNDDGGMWRIGSELRALGCEFTERARITETTVESIETGPVSARVVVSSVFEGISISRTITFYAGMEKIDFVTSLTAPDNTTITVSFDTTAASPRATMGIPYGEVERGYSRLYTPQFWPFKDWVDVSDDMRGLTFAMVGPQGVTYNSEGKVEFMLARNAHQEKCDILGPIFYAEDRERADVPYTMTFHGPGGWMQNGAYKAGYPLSFPLMIVQSTPQDGSLPQTFSLAATDRPEVIVTSVKPEEKGKGVIMRLYRVGSQELETKVSLGLEGIGPCAVVNAREKGQQGDCGASIGVSEKITTLLFRTAQ